MRLEKKMFLSNILVLVSALVALVLMCIAVIAAFEDPLEKGLKGQIPNHHWWETYLSNTYWTVLLIGVLVCFGLILVLLVVGLPLRFGCQPRERNFRAREGFLVVALSWVALSAFGALPFVFSGELPNYEDAFFEAVSGFTTTG